MRDDASDHLGGLDKMDIGEMGVSCGRAVAPVPGARREAGIEEVHLHDIRHTFASRALALGEGLPMIGKLLGHTQVQTTARYAHLARDTVKASAARIGDSIDQDLDAVAG